MVMKVKEPLSTEYKFFRKDLLLFTYLHLAAEPALTKALLDKKVTGVAYETVLGKMGGPRLPLLAPLSEVAGRRSVIIAATHLESHNGGLGILPGGVTKTEKSEFLVIGGGFAGYNAAFTAAGLGANVTILEMSDARIKQLKADEKLNGLKKVFKSKINIVKSNKANLDKYIKTCDALISTVLIPGKKAQKVVSEAQVKKMKKGSVIVDISIDQGGSVATIDRITTHDNPTFVKHGVIHYSVANMPGATPRTSTVALTNATLPYAKKLASKGVKALTDANFRAGLNTFDGKCTFEGVAQALKLKYVPAEKALKEAK
jgi:alanine dehydrogenase